MSEHITIQARLDTSKLEETEAEWKVRLRSLNSQINRTRVELKRTQMYGMIVMGSVLGMIRAFVTFLPEPLQALAHAAVTVITSAITAIMATAIAYSAGGPLTMLQAIMAWVAVGIALIGLFQVLQGQREVEAALTEMRAGMGAVEGSLSGLFRTLGGV